MTGSASSGHLRTVGHRCHRIEVEEGGVNQSLLQDGRRGFDLVQSGESWVILHTRCSSSSSRRRRRRGADQSPKLNVLRDAYETRPSSLPHSPHRCGGVLVSTASVDGVRDSRSRGRPSAHRGETAVVLVTCNSFFEENSCNTPEHASTKHSI